MNKLMYRFVATTKKKKIDPFLDTVCPLRASRVIILLSKLKTVHATVAQCDEI